MGMNQVTVEGLALGAAVEIACVAYKSEPE